jgi:hypothetical protein
MNDAIRSQRERGNVPKSMLPPEDEPRPVPEVPEPVASELPPEVQPDLEPLPEPDAKKGLLSRLLGRP